MMTATHVLGPFGVGLVTGCVKGSLSSMDGVSPRKVEDLVAAAVVDVALFPGTMLEIGRF